MHDAPYDALLALFEAFDLALHNQDYDSAGALLASLETAPGADDPETAYARARLVWAREGEQLALPALQRVLQLDPDHAEAHYDLGCMAEACEDQALAVQHFLRVRALDARGDRDGGIGTPAELDDIERIAREVLDGLPKQFIERLSHVPVLIERRPSRALVEEGFDPRAFGLFEGSTDAMQDAPMPTRIVLFAANLLAEFPDHPELYEQIEITLLHEIGHYFGLSEEDLERLGLD